MINRNDHLTAEGYGAARIFLAALLAISLVMLALAVGLAPPAEAQTAQPKGLAKAGPVDPQNGFPFWYEDKSGTRLDLCLDPTDQMCLQPFESPDPTGPVVFPDNFPGEAFWWTADAATTTSTGGDASLGMAAEAAFTNEVPREEDQASFGRVRVRIDGLTIGERYKVTYPFGERIFTAEDDGTGGGEINSTEDVGCFGGSGAPCKFDQNDAILSSEIGPFLKWDPAVGETAPPGYLGDPNFEHKVVGSPNNTDYFKVEKLNDDDTVAEQVAFTDLFAVSGKLATPQASPTVKSDTYNAIKTLDFVKSDPSYTVRYSKTSTTDGTEPAEPADPITSGTEFTGAFDIGQADTRERVKIKYVAFDAQGNPGEVKSASYVIDTVAPNVVSKTVNGDGPGLFDTPQQVVFEVLNLDPALNETARVFYTTDGSEPTVNNSKEFDPANPINVARSQTIKAIAVDNNGNTSKIETFKYTIASLAKMGPNNPATGEGVNGFPFWYEDANGVRIDQCLDPTDQMCLQPFEMTPDWQEGDDVNFPNKFPLESFWWTGDAAISNANMDASLGLAAEATFTNEVPKEGDQASFGRIRVRIDGLQIGEKYRVSHPYGTDTYVAEDDGTGGGEINSTEDSGCFGTPGTPCNFDQTRFGRVGPFLVWDNSGLTAPPGYVGDPNVEHAVTGSPLTDADGNAQNYFKVERLNADGSTASVLGSTNLFTVSGKLSELQVGASVGSGFYKAAQNVVLGASDPNAQIYYSKNQDSDTADEIVAENNLYGGPVPIDAMNATTTLRFVAVVPPADPATQQEVRSKVFTKTYTLDDTLPTVVADPAGGTFNDTVPPVTLKVTNPEPGTSKIYYTTNGSDPANVNNRTRVLFDPQSPINIRKDTVLKFMAIDQAGNPSATVTENYTVIDATPPLAPTALDLAVGSDSGESGTDNITNATTLTFTGNAEPGSTVKILVDGVEKGSGTAAEGTGAFSVTTSALDPGKDIPVTATATDPTGNLGPASGALNVTIDRTAPTTTATPGGGTYPRAQSVTLRPSEEAKVYYTRNGGTPNPGAAGTTQATGAINIAANTTLRFIAVDTAGNRSGVSTQTYRIQNASPTITGMSPTGVVGGNAVVRARVLDSDSQLTEANLTLTINGNRIPASRFTYTAAGQLSYNRPGVYPAGRYNVTLTVRDQDGGTATRSWSFRIR